MKEYAIIYGLEQTFSGLFGPRFITDDYGMIKRYKDLKAADSDAEKMETYMDIECVVISLEPVHE